VAAANFTSNPERVACPVSADWGQFIQHYIHEEGHDIDKRAERLISAAHTFVMTLAKYLPGLSRHHISYEPCPNSLHIDFAQCWQILRAEMSYSTLLVQGPNPQCPAPFGMYFSGFIPNYSLTFTLLGTKP
jgi:hypothetical protein